MSETLSLTWPPESILLGPDGPRYWRHRGGFVCGYKGWVRMMIVEHGKGRESRWPTCNRFGDYATLAEAIKLYDPFQNCTQIWNRFISMFHTVSATPQPERVSLRELVTKPGTVVAYH